MALTQKQENFCRIFVETGNASEAYRRAYNPKTMKAKGIATKASALYTREDIRGRIDEIRAKVEDEGILTFREIQTMLSERAMNGLNSDGLKAIDILNRMAGHYEKDNKQSAPIIPKIDIHFHDAD